MAGWLRNRTPERQEDPAEDLGPDPTWHRVHSTPAGSDSRMS